MSRRAEITMSDDEVRAFLVGARTVICATIGRDGWPHLMPLWYVLRDDRIWAWTYTKSQKARNLERDPRATLQVETGETYDQLRGVMLRTEAVLHREADVLDAFVTQLAARYSDDDPDGMRESFRRQIPKRVAIEFVERGRVTWDHRKLAGAY